MKEFNTKARIIRFKINGFEFRSKAHVSAGSIIAVTSDEDTKGVDRIDLLLKAILDEHSYEEFTKRLHLSGEEGGIDLEVLKDVSEWLVAEVSGRPLKKS